MHQESEKSNMAKSFNRGVLQFFLFLSLVLVLVNLVSAQTSFFKDISNEWVSGDLSDLTIRLLFTFIVFLFVVAVVGRLPGLGGEEEGKTLLRLILSVVITLLATAYIKIGELKAVLFAYSALGFVLSALIPFFILSFFSWELISPKGQSGMVGGEHMSNHWTSKFFVYLLWFGFLGFIIYRIVLISGADVSVSDSLKYAHYVLFGLAAFILLFMKTIIRKVTKAHYAESRAIISNVFKDASLVDEAERDEAEAILTATRKLNQKGRPN